MPAVTTPDPQPAKLPGSSRVCCSDGVNSRGTALGLPSSEKPGACPDSAVWLWGNAHPRKGRPRARRDRERAALHHADGRQGLSEAWALCAPGRRLPGEQDPAEAPPSPPRPPTRSKSLRCPGRSNAHGPPASRRRPESHGQPTLRGGPCAPAPQREEARASLANTQSVTGKCRCDSSTDLGVGRQDPTSSPFPPPTGLEAVSREARVHQGLDSCLRPSHPADGTSVPQALILPVTTARFAGGFRGREGVPSREPVPVPTGHTCPRSGPYSAHSDLR